MLYPLLSYHLLKVVEEFILANSVIPAVNEKVPEPPFLFDFIERVTFFIIFPEYPLNVNVILLSFVSCFSVEYVFLNITEEPVGASPDTVTEDVEATEYFTVFASTDSDTFRL